ncbi:pentatricopeptide repeat-containing protein At4g19220, mitochondrial-like [Aristolochia californica]|uniref:pentatricopeptide repeat-containing protein At4g19220, mitochondrial-like n=1 Tax=Aristolochia californica TaxID=171875 RepID=UPI0035E1CB8F
MLQRDLSSLLKYLGSVLNYHKEYCTKLDLKFIGSFHCLALKTGDLAHVSTSTSFVTLYARRGYLNSSWSLFHGISNKDVIAWNAMMSACLHNKCFISALRLFGYMLTDMDFDSTTLLIVISALSNLKKLQQGRVLHGITLKWELNSNRFLGNALLDMYARCGDLNCAELMFAKMEFRDSTSWNSMIGGYLHNGYPEKSLSCFTKMHFLGVHPDSTSLSSAISACSCLGELCLGASIHGLGIKLGYDETSNLSVTNALISFYSKCDFMDAAEKLFTGLTHRDVISWNSMIDGLAEQGRVTEAFDLLQKMQLNRTQPDSVTVLALLQLCTKYGLLREGKTVHGFALRRELQFDLPVTNSLLDMYMNCYGLRFAYHLFTSMDHRDLISWNTMIGGYSYNGESKEPKMLFRELLRSGPQCRLSTVLVILPSCNSEKDVQFGESTHCWMVKSGFLEDVLAVNALMLMYLNCRDMRASISLLETNKDIADIVSWNTIIVGSVQNGCYIEPLKAFNKMRSDTDFGPDSITLVSVISASGNLELKYYGALIHGLAQKTLSENDIQVKNALITMYCRCRDISSAELLFYKSPYKNLCSWNCMLSGLALNKDGKRALELFHHLEFKPNEFTLVSILTACTQLGALRHGREINGYVVRYGFQGNSFIYSALVDMYSKCGRLEAAVKIFRSSLDKSVASWNSMISAYGFHGYGTKAIKLSNEMCDLGIEVTSSTFIALLSACTHSGLVDEGWKHYNCMVEKFGIKPTIKHHVCMVHMLGRAGRLDEAYEFIKRIANPPESGVWGALLSACKDHGDLEMGKSVAEHLFALEPENTGYYILMANMYSAAGRWNDVIEVRKVIQEKQLRKPPGWSSIDLLP